MSLERTILVQCPQCQSEKEVRVWESLNVTVDPWVKKELIEGRINNFKCDQCGLKAQVPVPMLYNDMERRICVQYYPYRSIDEERFFEGFARDGSIRSDFGGEMHIPEYMRNWHIVFHMDELIRYVTFRERLAEYYKNLE